MQQSVPTNDLNKWVRRYNVERPPSSYSMYTELVTALSGTPDWSSRIRVEALVPSWKLPDKGKGGMTILLGLDIRRPAAS